MSERFTHKLLFPDKISDLLAVHRALVDQTLKKANDFISKSTNPQLALAAKHAPLDELFVLRFVLSCPSNKPEKAYENLIETLEWRSERLEALEAVHEGKPKYEEIVRKYSKVALLGMLNGLHPTMVVRAGRANTKGMFDEITEEQILENFYLSGEKVYHMCDKKSRETGLLCKQISVIDLEGFSLFNWNPQFQRVLSKSSHINAVHYPQLLGKTVIINMPVTFRLIYKAFYVFMPASTIEKQAVCPANTLKKSATECPFLKKFPNSVEMMPPFLGGTGPLPVALTLEKN